MSHMPLTFFRKQIFFPTPPKFVKFLARAKPLAHGFGSVVPTNDQVPELMKAQSSPSAAMPAIAEAVS